MVKCEPPSLGGCQIEILLAHLEIYAILLLLRDLLLIIAYLVYRLHRALQNVRSLFEKEVFYTCLIRDGHSCREMEVLEHDRSFLKARYDVISIQLMSLKDLASRYRGELKVLRDSRFESGKLYMEVLKGIEESWVSELEQKDKEYAKLLEVRNYLVCEVNDFRSALCPNLESLDFCLEDSDTEYVCDAADNQENEVPWDDALGQTTSTVSSDTEDFECHDSNITDFKMKICFFVQQSLLCGSSPISILTSLDMFTLSPEFCRRKCMLGIVLGTLKYLNSTNNLYCFSSITDTFSRLELLFAHFTEKYPDQFAILDEVFNFLSEYPQRLNACSLIVAAMCRVGVVDVFASSKWFKNCTDVTVLSHSIELLDWIHSEQHGTRCVLQRAPSRPEKPLTEEISPLESFPLIPYLQDLPSLGSDSSLYISNYLDSCVLLNGDIPFPPPGAFLARQHLDNVGFIRSPSAIRGNQSSASNATSTLKNCCGMQRGSTNYRSGTQKTVSFDTVTYII